jgi:DNA modification methylase
MTIRLLTGDCRDVMPTLADASVHCVVTSPPYYALRSYLDAEHPDKSRELGSEPTPDAYLAAMVGVFREVRRVLRDDGTCWVNMGDSYNSMPQGMARGKAYTRHTYAAQSNWDTAPNNLVKRDIGFAKVRRDEVQGVKHKDLLLMPARLALALQADGWWVRSDIIWAKPNPMPESCRDRPTSAHEHVFLLSKRARYFYDADAVREPNTEATAERYAAGYNASWKRAQIASVADDRTDGFAGAPDATRGRNLRNVWTIVTAPYAEAHFATFPPLLAERCIRAGTSERGCCAACGAPWVRQGDRELVDVWPSKQGAH